MKNRLLVAIAISVALSAAAALFAPAANATFHSYSSFKGKNQGKLKGESKKTNGKSNNPLTAKPLQPKSIPIKKAKATPKVAEKNPHVDLPPHPP